MDAKSHMTQAPQEGRLCFRWIARLLVLAGAAAFSVSAWAGPGTFSYTVQGSSPVSGSTNWGTLATPALISFSDTFTTASTATTFADNWFFTIPTSVVSGSAVAGEQLSLSNFTITGVLDSVIIYQETTAGSTLNAVAVKTWTPPAGSSSFTNVANYTLNTAGTYFLQVNVSQAANTIGSYAGAFVAAAIPEPSSIVLMGAGMLLVVTLTLKSRRQG